MPEVTSIQQASREFKSLDYSEKDILNIQYAHEIFIWIDELSHSTESSDLPIATVLGSVTHQILQAKCPCWPSMLGCHLLYLQETLAPGEGKDEVTR